MHVLDNPSLDLKKTLSWAERRVKTVTGYDIELTEKPLFGLNDQPIELARSRVVCVVLPECWPRVGQEAS